jgi:N6-adenosine-specific RNA methylase IME4
MTKNTNQESTGVCDHCGDVPTYRPDFATRDACWSCGEPIRRRYRTIVADPPWHYDGFPTTEATGRDKRLEPGKGKTRPMPYPSMSLDEIRGLPVRQLALDDARLFLWTTNRYLPEAFEILTSWGFTYRQTLVWIKPGVGPFGGSVARQFTEYLLVATIGKPERIGMAHSNTITASKSKAQHSRKPEAFLDLVEQVSPGPYVELFARRARFGWDYYGDESLGTVVMPTEAVQEDVNAQSVAHALPERTEADHG